MTFDPIDYWIARGPGYQRGFSRSPAFEQQERQLLGLLDRLEHVGSVLEVGCGFGRITELVRPYASEYVAIDVSPDQIEAARERVPDVDYVVSSIEDYDPGRTFDLVLAVEVLMHIPPAAIAGAIDKVLELAGRHVVTVDWTGPIRGRVARHNWLHDYAGLLEPSESEAIVGVEQSLFYVDRRSS